MLSKKWNNFLRIFVQIYNKLVDFCENQEKPKLRYLKPSTGSASEIENRSASTDQSKLPLQLKELHSKKIKK